VISQRSADLIAAYRVNEFNGGGLVDGVGLAQSASVRNGVPGRRLSAARAWIALNVRHFDDARRWLAVVETAAVADTAAEGGTDADLVALREVYPSKTGDLAAALQAGWAAPIKPTRA